MSHDRGCSCGKEMQDYSTCQELTCNKNNKTADTTSSTLRTANLKDTKTYVCIHKSHPSDNIFLVKGDEALAKSFNSNLRTDAYKYYVLGEEVEVKTTVQIIKTGVVYRNNSK